MRFNLPLYSYVFFIFIFTSCFTDVPEVEVNSSYQSNIIISNENHLAFPDIIEYNDTWYVSYRESDAHVNGTFSKIIVLKSNDFLIWEQCNIFELPGYDLRDPKFSYNEMTDSLYLHFHITNENGTLSKEYGSERKNIYVEFDKLKNIFNEKEYQELKQAPNFPNYWLWRPYWYNNKLYVGGYKTGTVNLLKYESINSVPIIISQIIGDGIGESTLSVYNNKMYILSRRRDDALFSVLPVKMDSIKKIKNNVLLPITDSKILSIGPLGGPNMILFDNFVFLGGRSVDGAKKDRTMFYKYYPLKDEIQHYETMISYGDNSYPGMMLKDNYIYGVYYTQNSSLNRLEIRSFVININDLSESDI